MIGKLRRRLTLLVIGVLVLVSAGIVLAIDTVNRRNIDASAQSALQLMRDGQGRPGVNALFGGQPPAGFDRREAGEAEDYNPDEYDPDDFEPGDLEPPESEEELSRVRGMRADRRAMGAWGGETFASLSNFYTIRLDADGAIAGWTSDRADLYSDEQMRQVAEAALALGADSGRVDTQYFCLSQDSGDGRTLIVLDARLEYLSARRMLRTTIMVAAAACVLLSVLACLLIRRMLEPVQQSFDRQKQFVWDASHEFKTPLAVISANAEVLSAEIGDNEYLGYIQSEVRRTDQLVQNLLTLARMDKGAVAPELRRVNLSNALLGVALPFESTVFEAGKRLETDIPDDVFVRGDEAMLQQLAVILLSNALKYSDDGGSIVVKLVQRGKGAVISVRNTGPGIEPDKLEKIFDRFYRGDSSHNSEIAGNGLGLAIARTIVEAHGGKIHAESEPGKWAEFIVTLPG